MGIFSSLFKDEHFNISTSIRVAFDTFLTDVVVGVRSGNLGEMGGGGGYVRTCN